MANKKLKNFEYASHCEPGKLHKANTDTISFYDTPNGYVFLICDAHAEIPESGITQEKSFSQITAERIRYYLENEVVESPGGAVYNALIYANGFVYEYARKNPGVEPTQISCSLVLVRDNKLFYATLGKSRILFFNGRRIYVLSEGYSPAEDGAQPQYLGEFQSIEPRVNLQPLVPVDDDMIVLCSDGFYENMPERVIQKILDDPMPVFNKVQRLSDMAVSGGTDDSVSLHIVSFYNLENTERSFTPVAARKSSKTRTTEKNEGTSESAGKPLWNDRVKEQLEKPHVRIALIVLAALALSYMFYDMFIREPRPARDIRIERPVERPVETPAQEAEAPDRAAAQTETSTAAAPSNVPQDRAYTVASGDTWGRIYTRFGVCSWFIRNHAPNAGKFDADENPVAGSRIMIPLVYSAKRDLNPGFYREFSLEKTGSRCENAGTEFLEAFRNIHLQ